MNVDRAHLEHLSLRRQHGLVLRGDNVLVQRARAPQREAGIVEAKIGFPCQSELVELAHQLSDSLGISLKLNFSLAVLPVKKHDIKSATPVPTLFIFGADK